ISKKTGAALSALPISTIFPPMHIACSACGMMKVGSPAASTCMSTPSPPVTSKIFCQGWVPAFCNSKGSNTSSAPTSLAIEALRFRGSNEIILLAPAAFANPMAPSPIGPAPQTTTVDPGLKPPARMNMALYATHAGSTSEPASKILSSELNTFLKSLIFQQNFCSIFMYRWQPPSSVKPISAKLMHWLKLPVLHGSHSPQYHISSQTTMSPDFSEVT